MTSLVSGVDHMSSYGLPPSCQSQLWSCSLGISILLRLQASVCNLATVILSGGFPESSQYHCSSDPS